MRIVANVATSDIEKAAAFYSGILGLEVLMDLGWIRTYGSGSTMTIQISVMSEGGSGTAVPDVFAGVIVVTGLVAVGASVGPALRAGRVDPARELASG